MIIYIIKNKRNGKVYIGQTVKTMERRFANHVTEAKWGRYYSIFHKALLKYGVETFVGKVLCRCTTQKDMNKKEIYYIKKYKSTNSRYGYNLTNGGDGRSGYKLSKKTKLKIGKGNKGKTVSLETRKRMSEIRKRNWIGKGNPFYGRHHSEKTKRILALYSHNRKKTLAERKKLSDAMCGKKHWNYGRHRPKSVKLAISKANTGKKRTEEEKRKMSARIRGKNNPFYGKHHTDKTKCIIRRKRKSQTNLYCKEYIITFPNGKKRKIKNLRKFCREHKNVKISLKTLGQYANKGKPIRSYNGYACEKVSD